jgi:hypothetical protein
MVSPEAGMLPLVIVISHTAGTGADVSSPGLGQQALTKCLIITSGVVVGVTETVGVGVGVGALHISQLE